MLIEVARMRSSGPRVALLIETSKSMGRGILQGVNRYVKEHEHWSIYLEPRDLGTEPPTWLQRWKGDGIIARVSEPRIAEIVLKSKMPAVNVSAALPELPFPRVECSPSSQARLAARHFVERGFHNFAFCGDKKHFNNWSTRIAAHFSACVRGSANGCEMIAEYYLGGRKIKDWDTEQDALAEWVAQLRKPVAILTINDPTGLRILEACHKAGIDVPESAAVLGLENDELVCSMADPALSSLIPNAQIVGYKAAEILDLIMKGQAACDQVISVEPIGIVTRQSTDVRAHYDDVVAAAVRFIRERAYDRIGVDDIVRKVNVSRSSLDRHFKSILGRTAHEEILRTKLKAAMQLLAETKLSLAEVAAKVGFEHTEYMGVVFRRELGITPGAYRDQAMNDPLGQVPDV
jgi:LacI family transcriptional regulator